MKAAKVKDIMSKEVQTLERNDTLNLAQGLMGQKRIRHFPVLGGDVLVGVVSQRDLFHATLGSVMNYGERSEEAYLATVAVKEVMQEPAIIVSPQVSVQEAAGLMVEKQIGCLPGVDEEKLVGIVTETDILKLVADM